MVYRSWCPDRTLHQARKYIADTMGERYAEGVILNLEATWEESNPQTPLICFLSMGSDPTGAIENLAKRKGIGKLQNVINNIVICGINNVFLLDSECDGCCCRMSSSVHGSGTGSACQETPSTVHGWCKLLLLLLPLSLPSSTLPLV